MAKVEHKIYTSRQQQAYSVDTIYIDSRLTRKYNTQQTIYIRDSSSTFKVYYRQSHGCNTDVQ